jgi:type IV secretory pathway VirB6-like protein
MLPPEETTYSTAIQPQILNSFIICITTIFSAQLFLFCRYISVE